MTKLYKVKSSATRMTKKDFGDDWKNQGCIKQDDAGMFFFELTTNGDRVALVDIDDGGVSLKEEQDEYELTQLVNEKAAEEQEAWESDAGISHNGDDADQGEALTNDDANRPTNHDLRVSTISKPCSNTWDIAIEMNKQASEANRPAPKRKEVIMACVDAGVAYNTARTQYQAWFKANKG